MSSGLGGMSGAQPKAATICGCIGVVAEVSCFFFRSYKASFIEIRIKNSS